MQEVNFTYLRKTYKGYLAVSTAHYPHYYWYFMEDPELCEELGDCLCFKREADGMWAPTEPLPQHQERLISTIRAAVERSISADAAAR